MEDESVEYVTHDALKDGCANISVLRTTKKQVATCLCMMHDNGYVDGDVNVLV